MQVVKVSKGSISRRTQDKKYVAQIVLTFDTGKTRRISRLADSKRDAQKTLCELREAALQYNEVNNPPPEPTRHKEESFVYYLEGDYLHEKEFVERIGKRTLYASRNTIRKHIKPFFKDKRPDEITPREIALFYVELGKKYSASTVHKAANVISNAYRKLMRDGIVKKSPCEFVKKPSIIQEEKKPLTEDEVKRMIKATDIYDRDPWTKTHNMPVYIRLALATGMRRGELCALKWEHIDWEHGYIEVKKAIAYLGNKMEEKSTKSGKSRSIAVSENILDMLKKHRRKYATGTHIFPDKRNKNKPQNPESIRHAMDIIARESGIERLTMHLLRHTNISIMGARGIDIRTIAMRAGHSQLTTTMRYLHTNEELNRRAGDIFKDI